MKIIIKNLRVHIVLYYIILYYIIFIVDIGTCVVVACFITWMPVQTGSRKKKLDRCIGYRLAKVSTFRAFSLRLVVVSVATLAIFWL